MLLFWDKMNQREINEAGDECVVTIVISSLEQHALHLPTGTDRFIGEAILHQVAQKSKQTFIVLPSIPYGFSSHHMAFKGTISLEQLNLVSLIKNIVQSLEKQGFKQILIFNSHGGNTPAIKVAVNELGITSKGNICLVEYWDFLREHIGEIRDSEIGGIGHAGEMETSIMMYLQPDRVNLPVDKKYDLASDYKGGNPDMFAENKVYMYRDFTTISPYGNVGVPDYSSAEKGLQIIDLISNEIATYVDEYLL